MWHHPDLTNVTNCPIRLGTSQRAAKKISDPTPALLLPSHFQALHVRAAHVLKADFTSQRKLHVPLGKLGFIILFFSANILFSRLSMLTALFHSPLLL